MSTEELEQQVTAENVASMSEVPNEETKTGEPDAPEVVETDEEKQAREAQEREERTERKAKGVQKRIDELTREKHEAARRADEALELNKRLVAMLENGGKPQQQAKQDLPPNRDDFKTADGYFDDVAYVEALTDYKARKVVGEQLSHITEEQSRRQQEQSSAQEQHRIAQDFINRRKAVEKTIPDYREVIEDWEPSLPESTSNMILRLEDGPLLSYHLAKNPELEAQFSQQPEYMHGVIIGQILSAIKGEKKTTSAPTPGKPVKTSSAGTATEPPSDPEQYRAWADKHLK